MGFFEPPAHAARATIAMRSMTLEATGGGRVFLVGAGPGDPALITLRGLECLRRADLVLHDYLVNASLLEHAAHAEIICLGRHGRGRLMPQEEIHERMIDAARSGRTVVRLKGGDGAVFGRLGEELEALRAAGIPFEVVPGVTAASAAVGYAGIPLTHREVASAVAFVTGRRGGDELGRPLDFAALAAFPGTLVWYMGVTTAAEWTGKLIASGMRPDTPCAVVRHCSTPRQRVFRCPLSGVANLIAREHIRPPALVIVGGVARLPPICDWFMSRPLFGKCILVTRPVEQAGDLESLLRELGAEVVTQPAIEIGDPPSWTPVDAAIAQLAKYAWIVFSSVNGVRYFLDRMDRLGLDARALGTAQVAAIGRATAEALAHRRLRADLVPDVFDADALGATLASVAAGNRFLLVRASRGREVLAERIRAAGGQADQIVCYRSLDVSAVDEAVRQALEEGRIDWVTVTSSAIARSLARLFGENLGRARVASISPITSQVLVELGYRISAEASQYTMHGLVDAIVQAECSRSTD